MGYSFRVVARVLLYASSHRQDDKYHGLCYTSRGALAGTRNNQAQRRGSISFHLDLRLNTTGVEGRKDMFYLTTHSTHFILRLYGDGHMVKDHSDGERGNPLPPHRLLLPINSQGSFICTIPQTG